MKIILAVVLLTILYLFGMSKLDNIRQRDLNSLTSHSVVSSVSSSSSSSSSSVTTATITISGAVTTPGTYNVTLYVTLNELIAKAGGLTANADPACFNVDYIIDGTEKTIYIPAISETAKVSINSGDATALDTLPSIGPTLATAIIKYRSTHGAFQRLEDITNVEGIGTGTFNKICDYITLE